MSAPLDITEEEVYVAPFKGWRVWNIGPWIQGLEGVVTDGTLATAMVSYPPPWRLRSLFNGKAWPVKQPMCRECLCQKDELGVRGSHSCGIYAFKDIFSMMPHLLMNLAERGRGRTINPEELLVIGEVNLWGEVDVHEAGYRAEFAYPENIYFINGFGRTRFTEQGVLDYGMEAGDVDLLSLMDWRENEINEILSKIALFFPNERFSGVGLLEAAFLAVGSDFGYSYRLRMSSRGR